jgi:hypothetical protein
LPLTWIDEIFQKVMSGFHEDWKAHKRKRKEHSNRDNKKEGKILKRNMQR